MPVVTGLWSWMNHKRGTGPISNFWEASIKIPKNKTSKRSDIRIGSQKAPGLLQLLKKSWIQNERFCPLYPKKNCRQAR